MKKLTKTELNVEIWRRHGVSTQHADICCNGSCQQGRQCPRYAPPQRPGLLSRAASRVMDVLVAIGAALLLAALGIYPKDKEDRK